MRGEDIITWLSAQTKEYKYEELKHKFGLTETEWNGIKELLINKGFLEETETGEFKNKPSATIFIEKFKLELPKQIEVCLESLHNLQGVDKSVITDWAQLNDIEEFVTYPGEEKIYEIRIAGKVIKMEGKEITDYNVFILRFFEEFGVMLPKYKGVANDWGKLVSHWNRSFGKVDKDMSEHLSVGLEAREALIDYINSCIVSDDYIVKDGMVTVKNGCIYVPTRAIKKFLKRAELFITIRKLGYVMKDVLLSGSIPIKIENKSERFWRLDPKKFDLRLDDTLHLESEEEESEEVKEKEEVKETPVETKDVSGWGD